MDYRKLWNLMESKGVSASDVSKATGVSRSMFTDWKMGRYSPKMDKLMKIAEYFDVDVSYFADNDPKPDIAVFSNRSGKNDIDYLIEIRQNTESESLKALMGYAVAIAKSNELKKFMEVARDSKPKNIKVVTEILKNLNEATKDY